MLTYKKICKGHEHDEADTSFEFYAYENGVKVGEAYVLVDDERGDAFVDWIEIYEGNRGRGLGTEFLLHLAGSSEYGEIVLAPNNENAQRLYERIGEDASERKYDRYLESWQYVDQGYGVYRID